MAQKNLQNKMELPFESDEYFYSESRYKQLLKTKGRQQDRIGS
jgi:hypothetical protein